MNNNTDIENILKERGVKPTANRITVFRELSRLKHPVNLAELEEILFPMDKTSIFRVLELFSEKELVHVLEDGSRSLKYELCSSKGHHSVSDQHAHFYCEKCGAVYCLEDVALPETALPSGYTVKSANYMLKGICAKCN